MTPIVCKKTKVKFIKKHRQRNQTKLFVYNGLCKSKWTAGGFLLMNETDKANYLMETFAGDKAAIGKVIHEIITTASYSEMLYYKKVRNIINNQKN